MRISLATIWVVVLVAAISAMIYSEIDEPTIRSVTVKNTDIQKEVFALNQRLSVVNEQLYETQYSLTSTEDKVHILASKNREATKQLESINSSFPVEEVVPTTR
ncbi:uncharacterized protein METZ01_LOCUS366151 [marine metagenome]|uniref:Uncharacterized protein n=1 Tax=marine metagenome TaxID=408172 RepID=A0A382SVQ6_9ZZZZ